VAALASWLDARAHHGQWLVRIEDVDTTRCLPDIDQIILQQLAACGLVSDLPVVYQSQRSARYQQALDALVVRGLAYPCACTRKDIETALQHNGQRKPRHGELIYPGTCRAGLRGQPARAWRFRTDLFVENKPSALMRSALPATNSDVDGRLRPITLAASLRPDTLVTPTLRWLDRRLGPQQQDVAAEVGDFILKRADGCFAYQLAVVVDDAAQGITDVVRGADLADNTARQILLQSALGLPTPRYLHTPLVLGANGEKLSKQNGAQALDLTDPLRALNQAAKTLGLAQCTGHPESALLHWVTQWETTVFQLRP
jgi:glutamyl-Q tRNA(Asp) synthetase